MSVAADERYVLAFDLGSGGPKVALVSNRGRLVGCVRHETSTRVLPGGGAEQDPGEWWRAIDGGVRELLAQRLVPPEAIVAVSSSSQWSVTVAVDQEGRHLMPALHWMDTRGAPYSRRVTAGWPKVSGYGLRRLLRWLRTNGGAPTESGVDALAHMLFIKHERPDVYRQTYKFLEPMDYVNVRLTGEIAASGATVFPYLLTDNRDNSRIVYDDLLVRWSDLDPEKLPQLRPVDSVLGPLRDELAADWGLVRGTPVVMGINDSQAATIGSGAVLDYQGHFCVGTSSWLSCHVPFKKTDLVRYIATMPAAVPGRNMVVAEQGAAGKCLEVFVDQWLYPADEPRESSQPISGDAYARAEQLAAGVPAGSDQLIFLPWLNGAGPPSGDGHMRGGFINQNLRTGRAEAVRAVMEGVAYNVRWLQGGVERFIGRRFPTLNFIGGAAQSDLWCQIFADVLGVPVRRVVEPQRAIVRGAGLSALMALGYLKLEEIPDLVAIDRTFEPNPAHRGVYDQLFAEFVNCYRANRRIFARLNPG